MSTHESYKNHDEVKTASERSFGYVFSIVFALVGLFPLLSDNGFRLWAIAISLCFFLIALVQPKLLKPLNWLWMKIGFLLHFIVTPIVMGIIFFLTVLPTGLIRRMAGKDSMDMKWDKETKTYWVKRESGEPTPDSMKNQF